MDTIGLLTYLSQFQNKERISDVDSLNGPYIAKDKANNSIEVGKVFTGSARHMPLVKINLDTHKIDQGESSYLDEEFKGNIYQLRHEEYIIIRNKVLLEETFVTVLSPLEIIRA